MDRNETIKISFAKGEFAVAMTIGPKDVVAQYPAELELACRDPDGEALDREWWEEAHIHVASALLDRGVAVVEEEWCDQPGTRTVVFQRACPEAENAIPMLTHAGHALAKEGIWSQLGMGYVLLTDWVKGSLWYEKGAWNDFLRTGEIAVYGDSESEEMPADKVLRLSQLALRASGLEVAWCGKSGHELRVSANRSPAPELVC